MFDKHHVIEPQFVSRLPSIRQSLIDHLGMHRKYPFNQCVCVCLCADCTGNLTNYESDWAGLLTDRIVIYCKKLDLAVHFSKSIAGPNR